MKYQVKHTPVRREKQPQFLEIAGKECKKSTPDAETSGDTAADYFLMSFAAWEVTVAPLPSVMTQRYWRPLVVALTPTVRVAVL